MNSILFIQFNSNEALFNIIKVIDTFISNTILLTWRLGLDQRADMAQVFDQALANGQSIILVSALA